MPHSLKSRIKSLCYKGKITEKDRDKIIQALEQQPCEVTPKTGKWIEYCYQNFSCSDCDYIVADTDINEYKYCPKCGARMEVKE